MESLNRFFTVEKFHVEIPSYISILPERKQSIEKDESECTLPEYEIFTNNSSVYQLSGVCVCVCLSAKSGSF